MADYFAKFSVEIELDVEAIDWALQLNRYLADMYHGKSTTLPCPPSVRDAAGNLMQELDYYPGCMVEKQRQELVVYSNADADAEATAAFIQAVLKQFGLNQCVRMHVAYTCTRPVPDGFGGTVCVITRKDIAWLDVNEWIVNKEAGLLSKLQIAATALDDLPRNEYEMDEDDYGKYIRNQRKGSRYANKDKE